MYNRYSNGANTDTDIVKRVDALVRFEEELKNGRGYTSGRSGVLGYTIPDTDAYDTMTVQRIDGQPTGDMASFILLPTGSMSVGKTFKITSTYVPKYQDYPVTAPFLQVFANGVEMTYNATTGVWSATNGTTWSVQLSSGMLGEITNWNNPKYQQWETYITYFNTANITIQIKMRIKSTDKGIVSNMAVIF